MQTERPARPKLSLFRKTEPAREPDRGSADAAPRTPDSREATAAA